MDQETQFWNEAARHGLRWFWKFRRTPTVESIERERPDLRVNETWRSLKSKASTGDQIQPFCYNRNTMALRKGYLLMRNGKPIAGILTEVS